MQTHTYDGGFRCNFSFAIRRISVAFFLSNSASCLSLRANSNSRCTSLRISSTSCFMTWARRRISRDWCNVDGTLSFTSPLSIPVHRGGGGCSSSEGSGLSERALLSPLLFFITLAYCRVEVQKKNHNKYTGSVNGYCAMSLGLCSSPLYMHIILYSHTLYNIIIVFTYIMSSLHSRILMIIQALIEQ